MPSSYREHCCPPSTWTPPTVYRPLFSSSLSLPPVTGRQKLRPGESSTGRARPSIAHQDGSLLSSWDKARRKQCAPHHHSQAGRQAQLSLLAECGIVPHAPPRPASPLPWTSLGLAHSSTQACFCWPRTSLTALTSPGHNPPRPLLRNTQCRVDYKLSAPASFPRVVPQFTKAI